MARPAEKNYWRKTVVLNLRRLCLPRRLTNREKGGHASYSACPTPAGHAAFLFHKLISRAFQNTIIKLVFIRFAGRPTVNYTVNRGVLFERRGKEDSTRTRSGDRIDEEEEEDEGEREEMQRRYSNFKIELKCNSNKLTETGRSQKLQEGLMRNKMEQILDDLVLASLVLLTRKFGKVNRKKLIRFICRFSHLLEIKLINSDARRGCSSNTHNQRASVLFLALLLSAQLPRGIDGRESLPGRERKSPPLPFPRPSTTVLTEGERRGALNRAVDVWGVARVHMGKRITIAKEQDAFTERSADESALVSSMCLDIFVEEKSDDPRNLSLKD
ncbi:hypothetical protein EAG_02902 [Camponotus floridanus]|uniref:Uncharacterized protein n=1 Tax=Camponotus floridanus TaxID=104421 RepID=E1ZVS5_CAMFO|nr:hypothetical protein EAG_02902 [Camponotus floridanus]